MLYSCRSRLFALLAVVGALLVTQTPMLRAQTIVSDHFSGTNGASLQGRTPDTTDLPGSTYNHTTFGGTALAQIDTSLGNVAPSAQTGFNDTVYLSIASAGSYTKPTSLHLSIDLRMGSLRPDASGYVDKYDRGIGLGFFTTTPSGNATTNFTGLNVAPDGTLYLVNNGSRTTASASAPNPFSTSQFYTLSYDINTSTGALSNVIYNGVNDSSSFTGANAVTINLTTSNSNLAGFYGSSGVTNSDFGYVDNFAVTTVPEPSTASVPLAVLILVGIGARLHRSRRVVR